MTPFFAEDQVSKEYPTGGEKIGAVVDAIDAFQKKLDEFRAQHFALWHKIPTLDFKEDLEHWTLTISGAAVDFAQEVDRHGSPNG
jgi:hypothetical protein